MNDRECLERVKLAAKVYNDQRLHKDFQANEIHKFVEWMYKQYGVVYTKD